MSALVTSLFVVFLLVTDAVNCDDDDFRFVSMLSFLPTVWLLRKFDRMVVTFIQAAKSLNECG